MNNSFLNLKSQMPMQPIRHATQLGITVFMLYIGIAYSTAMTDGAKTSIDALNPLDKFQAIWRWLVVGGQSVSKTQFSNFVLAIGLLLAVLYAGMAFCRSVNLLTLDSSLVEALGPMSI